MLDIVKLSSLNNVSTWHPQRIKQSLMFLTKEVKTSEKAMIETENMPLYPIITYKIQYVNYSIVTY